MKQQPATKPPPKPGPASGSEKAAWILSGLALLLILWFKLVPSLLAGLLVYSLIHILTGRLTGKSLTHHRAKIAATTILGFGAVALATVIIFMIIGIVRGRVGDQPQMYAKMAAVLHHVHDLVPPALRKALPDWLQDDAEELRELAEQSLDSHAQEVQHLKFETLRMGLHALVGIVMGVLVSFEGAAPKGPFGMAMLERVKRFALAFERVVFAQVRISALNTSLTALFLLVVLPTFDVKLEFRTTLVAITFVTGLLPVVGNLISNGIIFLISLDHSPAVAVTSLVYLVVIHKLEYFLNAKIIGGRIKASAWEILMAMFLAEAAFGITGVIAAPIIYAYVKNELSDRGLI